MDEDRAPTPEESWAIIDAQRREAHRQTQPDDRLLYGTWGLAWLIGYAGMFVTTEPGAPPGLWGSVLFTLVIVAAIVVTIVHSERRSRGLGGAGGRMNARLGLAWPIAFVSMFLIFAGTFSAGFQGPAVGIITNAMPCLVVACLFMGGGAAWGDARQFRLGIWVALVTGIASLVGFPFLYLVMASLGGGGFLLAAVLSHRDRLRS